MTLYEQLRKTCAEHDTTLSAVLKAIGRSDGSTGSWKAGKVPRLDVIMEIASYLHISLDELVYGKKPQAPVSESERELLEIFSRIPASKQELCKDFLRTHMAEPEKYTSKIDA